MMSSDSGNVFGGGVDDPFQEAMPVQEPVHAQTQQHMHEPPAHSQQGEQRPQEVQQPHVSSTAAPTATPTATTAAASSANAHRALPYLATFVAEAAVLGTGVIRPITFFPIVTTLRPGDSSEYPVPDVPVGPHMRGFSTGVGRNKWEPSSTSQLDRRYSELVEFRTLLAYQFPTMIIPPLPPKSRLDDLGTFVTKENILIAQQRTIQRFLREIALMPEVIYFSAYTPSFFQLPREAFEDWVEKMRVLLEDFRVCNASIVAHSRRKGGLLGSERVASIAGNSSKAVRKFVKYFGSWMGGGKDKGEAEEAQPEAPKATKTIELPNAVPFASGSHSPYPNPSPDGVDVVRYLAYWGDVAHFLQTYRDALAAAAPPYFAFVKNSMENTAALKDVADALKAYGDVLHVSPADGELSCAADRAHELCVTTANSIEKQQTRNKREVHERLLFEMTYIDAALDAVDHVQCLWIHCNELGEGVTGPFSLYARDVSDKLKVFYEERFLVNFRRRMATVMHQMAVSGQQYAQEMESCMLNSVFIRSTQDPNYLAYNADT